ncbi:putative MFS monocarboxylate transporter [Xylariales sp. PMI_506]|nr:putative MFS monocarboxylate transporter [Xylariales sp. PMI_506]
MYSSTEQLIQPDFSVSDPSEPWPSRSTENSLQTIGECPDGGFRAWSITIAAAGNTFCCLGWMYSYGVLQAYYENHQLSDRSPSEISWIGSLQIFFMFACSLVSGPIFDRIGAVVCVLFPAVAGFICSIMLTSICQEYYQFILAQGVLGGISLGFVATPGMAATGQYFKKNMALAMGVMVGGSSLGGTVIPIVLDKMFADTRLGFGWAVQICGCPMAIIMGSSCFIIRPCLPSRRQNFFLPEAFRDSRYVVLIAAGFMNQLGVFAPPFFLPDFAVAYGIDPSFAVYLISMFNAASLFGRIIPGILADRFGRYNVYFIATVGSAILGFCWQRLTTTPGIIAFAMLYGFCSGAITSMQYVFFNTLPDDPRDIGTYIGMGMAVCSIATLIGPPINGAILDAQGFGRVADISGAVMGVGSILILIAKCLNGTGIFSLD